MPTWLVEGHPIVYFVLGVGLIVSSAAWWRTRRRPFAIAAGVLAALIVGYWLLDRAVESDGEQMVRKVAEVADAVTRHDLNVAFQNVSDQFDRRGKNKRAFRDFCEQRIRLGQVTAVRVWDEEAIDVSRPAGKGTVQFRFKVAGSWGETPPNYLSRVDFVLDPDGQWRVKTFEVYNALGESRTPVAIPGW